MATKPFDVVSFVMAFEGGELSNRKIVEGFSQLYKLGLLQQLQGSYQRAFISLVNQGYLNQKGQVTTKGRAL